MRAVVRFARKYEKKLGKPIWSDDVLDKGDIYCDRRIHEELDAFGLANDDVDET